MNIFNSFQSDSDKGVKRDSGYMYGTMMPENLYFGEKQVCRIISIQYQKSSLH